MIKLCCLGLILFVVSLADGDPHYIHGETILQVRQYVNRRSSGSRRSPSCGCDSCPAKTKPACRSLGGLCMSCSKSCNGDIVSGAQYCGGHCRCCVPRTIWTTTATNVIDAPTTETPTTETPTTETPTTETPTTETPTTETPTTEVPTTEAPPPPPRRSARRAGCKGSYKGLNYNGLCKVDCAATDMVETDDHDCSNTRSSSGSKICCIEKPLEHCNISGTPYKSGKTFKKNCMMFECDNGTLTSELKYNIECATCKARNDPHFQNFDRLLFNWHGQTDALIVQQGRDECPDHYVGMAFRDCTSEKHGVASCWNTVFYQTQSGVQISVPRFKHNIDPFVIVDGYKQTLKVGEISILKGGDGTEVSVIGFTKDKCLHFMGIEDEAFLVVVCSFQVIVYAYPSKNKDITGLCGSWNNIRTHYELRNGTQIERPNYSIQKNAPSVFGYDWEMPDCLFKTRRKRSAEIAAVSEEDPCNATVSQRETFHNSCSESISAFGSSLDNETKTELMDNCEFDLCIAIAVANDPVLAAEFKSETESVAVQAESAANDTVQYPPGQPGAPNATDQGTDFVDLEWAEPEEAEEANITNYVIQRRDLSGGDWVQCGEVNGILNQTTITDIELDHEYIFQVIAVSEAGSSEPSEPSESVLFASPYVPTTEAPTTETPTTEAPTTEAPTTEAPNTEAPTTEAPTTEAPNTEAPTTEAPNTEAPTTEVPTTEAPTTEAPTTEAATTEADHIFTDPAASTVSVTAITIDSTEAPTTESLTTIPDDSGSA